MTYKVPISDALDDDKELAAASHGEPGLPTHSSLQHRSCRMKTPRLLGTGRSSKLSPAGGSRLTSRREGMLNLLSRGASAYWVAQRLGIMPKADKTP